MQETVQAAPLITNDAVVLGILTIGYALGTYAAWFGGQIMRVVAGG